MISRELADSDYLPSIFAIAYILHSIQHANHSVKTQEDAHVLDVLLVDPRSGCNDIDATDFHATTTTNSDRGSFNDSSSTSNNSTTIRIWKELLPGDY
jgi:hypothetical protein